MGLNYLTRYSKLQLTTGVVGAYGSGTIQTPAKRLGYAADIEDPVVTFNSAPYFSLQINGAMLAPVAKFNRPMQVYVGAEVALGYRQYLAQSEAYNNYDMPYSYALSELWYGTVALDGRIYFGTRGRWQPMLGIQLGDAGQIGSTGGAGADAFGALKYAGGIYGQVNVGIAFRFDKEQTK